MPDEGNSGPILDAQRDPRMRFRVDWFINATEGRRRTPRESTEQLWNRCLLPMTPRPESILEIGLAEGRSTMWLLQNLKPKLWVGIDPWQPDRRWHGEQFDEWKSNFLHNMATLCGMPFFHRHGKVHYCQANGQATDCWLANDSSLDYLRSEIDRDFPGQPFDMAYVDGNHSALGAMSDLILSWRKLKPGGLLIFDDFDRRWHNARPHCHEAMVAFWMCVEHFARAIPITDATTGYQNRRQVWLRKLCD